jgi:hypothetical protein
MIAEELLAAVVNSPIFKEYLSIAAGTSLLPDADQPKDPTIPCCVGLCVVASLVIFAVTRKNKTSNQEDVVIHPLRPDASSGYRQIPANEGRLLIAQAAKDAYNYYLGYIFERQHRLEVGWPRRNIEDEHHATLAAQQEWHNIQEQIDLIFQGLERGKSEPASGYLSGNIYLEQTSQEARDTRIKLLKKLRNDFSKIALPSVNPSRRTSKAAHEERMGKGLDLLRILSSMSGDSRNENDDNIIDL